LPWDTAQTSWAARNVGNRSTLQSVRPWETRQLRRWSGLWEAGQLYRRLGLWEYGQLYGLPRMWETGQVRYVMWEIHQV
jgi:hypothetical protein